MFANIFQYIPRTNLTQFLKGKGYIMVINLNLIARIIYTKLWPFNQYLNYILNIISTFLDSYNITIYLLYGYK